MIGTFDCIQHTYSIYILLLPADPVLTVDHTMRVFKILDKAREDWYFIGDGIGCTPTDLNEIEAKHSSNLRMCLLKMFQRRIQQGGLSRSMLCECLRGEFVGRDDVATEIEALDLYPSN